MIPVLTYGLRQRQHLIRFPANFSNRDKFALSTVRRDYIGVGPKKHYKSRDPLLTVAIARNAATLSRDRGFAEFLRIDAIRPTAKGRHSPTRGTQQSIGDIHDR